MPLTRFTDAHLFRDRAEAFLVRREAENNLPLGLSSALMAKPDLYPSQPYFAVVESAGQVTAAAMMTPPHRLVLAWTEDREAVDLIAHDVLAFRPDTPGVFGPKTICARFAQTWQALTGRRYRLGMAERVYKLERVRPPAGTPGALRRVGEGDRGLLLKWIDAFQREALGEEDPEAVQRIVHNSLTLPPELTGTFLWEDGGIPVSLTRYGGPTPHGMRLGPVYTPPEFRGRGYASACVAAVSQYLLDAGRRFVFLFTDLSNPTSNKIYQNVGFEPVADLDEIRFYDAAPEPAEDSD